MDKTSPLPDANSEGAAMAATEAEPKRVAKKFAPWVVQTSPWMSGEISAPSVEEFLEANPDGLARLYVQAFPLSAHSARSNALPVTCGSSETQWHDSTQTRPAPGRPQPERRHSAAHP